MSACQLGNASGDGLPGANACFIAGERQGTDLLSDVKRGLVAMRLQHLVGAGPEFPLAEHQPKYPANP